MELGLKKDHVTFVQKNKGDFVEKIFFSQLFSTNEKIIKPLVFIFWNEKILEIRKIEKLLFLTIMDITNIV